MNEIQTIDNELDNLANAAMNDAGFQKMLKFKKGDYFCDGQEIARGTQMIAQCLAWTKKWIKFWDRRVAEKHIYRVIKGELAPDRDQMSDLDTSLWQNGLDNKPTDPWVLQYLLPMEDPETGEIYIFVTSSTGGRIAISELVDKYVAKRKRDPALGQPLIRLQKTMMPTGGFGNVPRPLFEIISYDTGGTAPMREVAAETLSNADMDDEIPF
jgi:hypothetical protein